MTGDSVDQAFISLKHWLLSFLSSSPDWVQAIASSLLNISAVLGVFMSLFALISVLERKILGRIQNRYGPNRVGPFGLFQPVADGIKLLIKEDIVPDRADKVVHFLAPIMMAVPAILALGVIPYGRNMTAFSIDSGILFFFAVGSATELAVFMAGWGSNNKFSMLGAMRAIAQMVSYELPLIITVLPVVMIVGLAFGRRDRPGAGGVCSRFRSALVCLHAVGRGRLHFVFRLGPGGVEPDAVRHA